MNRSIFRQILNLLTHCRSVKMHTKCRNSDYPKSNGVKRSEVPDEFVSWSESWPEYSPIDHTSEHIHGQVWADPDLNDSDFQPVWNDLDGGVNRVSHEGNYEIVDGKPLNIQGRTGIRGRGCLGRWGPNHAADPIVTRWKREDSGEKVMHEETNNPILQFVAIERRDCKEWAIPGGMVDPGEVISITLRREFLEEALNALEVKNDDTESMVSTFFENGREIYKGYVDDPRNTDNAWMETVAVNFHDDDGSSVGQLPLQAGDDAKSVTWLDLHSGIELYASHCDMLKKVVDFHKAHW